MIMLKVAFLTNRLELPTHTEAINDLMAAQLSHSDLSPPFITFHHTPRDGLVEIGDVFPVFLFLDAFFPSITPPVQRCLLLFASHLSKLGAIKTGFT